MIVFNGPVTDSKAILETYSKGNAVSDEGKLFMLVEMLNSK